MHIKFFGLICLVLLDGIWAQICANETCVPAATCSVVNNVTNCICPDTIVVGPGQICPNGECIPPEAIENGAVVGNAPVELTTEYTFSCNQGFTLQGASSTVCNHTSGPFTELPPSCVVSSSPTPSPATKVSPPTVTTVKSHETLVPTPTVAPAADDTSSGTDWKAWGIPLIGIALVVPLFGALVLLRKRMRQARERRITKRWEASEIQNAHKRFSRAAPPEKIETNLEGKTTKAAAKTRSLSSSEPSYSEVSHQYPMQSQKRPEQAKGLQRAATQKTGNKPNAEPAVVPRRWSARRSSPADTNVKKPIADRRLSGGPVTTAPFSTISDSASEESLSAISMTEYSS